MGEEKEGVSKKNFINLIFILAFAIFAVFIFGFAAAQVNSVFNSGRINYTNYSAIRGLPVNEDMGHIYNITINNSGIAANLLNVTNVTIFFWGNFILNNEFYTKTIKTANNNLTGNLTGVGDEGFVSVKVTNTSDYITWNATNSTSYVFPFNRSVGVNRTWFMFNATASTPGAYNMTIRLGYNFAASYYEHNLTVYVNDTTSPDVLPVNLSIKNNDGTKNSTSTAGNYHKGIVILNATISDNGGAVRSVFFNLTNSSSGNSTMFYKALNSSTSEMNWNYSLNTALLPDGNYTLIVYANDTNGNMNTTARLNFTIDNTAPTGDVECGPFDSYVGGTVTCTCSFSDATSGEDTSYACPSPSTTTAGTSLTSTYSFADKAGNTGSAVSNTYNLWGHGGGSSGGPSGTTFTYSKTIQKTEQDFSQIQSIETSSFSGGGLGAREKVTFKLNNEEHYLGIRALTTSSVTVEIASTPTQTILNIGQDVKKDLDSDGFYDILVKLNNIVNGKADLTISYIHEEISPVSEEEGITVSDKTCAELNGIICLQDEKCDIEVIAARDDFCCTGECIKQQISYLKWIIIGLVGLVTVVVISIVLFKKKKRK